ncbi:MAG: glycosyltransferase [Planctomycetaceae bacterium]
MNLYSQLEPLPEPVYFVFKGGPEFRDLFENRDNPPAVEDVFPRFLGDTTATWLLQTFLQLKRRGLNVHLVDRLVPNRICVSGIWQIGKRALLGRSYNVVVQADCCRPPVADHIVVQNPTGVLNNHDHLIYHWPQPGLIARNPDRGDRIENVVYRGTMNNLWSPLQAPAFTQRLAEIGVNFVCDNCDDQKNEDRYRLWQDYSDADLVLAMRDLTVYDERIKPATKLANAWLAGVPAILGPESAYQDLRSDDLDYIEARSCDDVVNAVRRLKENPDLYNAMRSRAVQRAPGFTADAVAQLWRDTLAGPVTHGYRNWLQESSATRILKAAVQHPWVCLSYRGALNRYLVERSQGPKILSES